jgi:hypothetical protein
MMLGMVCGSILQQPVGELRTYIMGRNNEAFRPERISTRGDGDAGTKISVATAVE